jgi:hypothetical protein
VIYAPDAPEPIVLDGALLEQSRAREGGVVMGRSTPQFDEIASRMNIEIFQLKDDLGLATRLSTGVAEGVMRLLIELTQRILREHRILVVGYGVTGAVITDYLVAAHCAPQVAARHPLQLERARQCGATPVAYDDRVEAMAAADIIINTVPSISAIPPEAFAQLGECLVGGLDHDAARNAGVRVHWPRGLAGGRAPLTAGDAQYAFIAKAIATRDSISSASTSLGEPA